MTRDVAAVVIGRNEGARLLACLDSLRDQVDQIVYVDSGSTDGSVDAARQSGCMVVELDTARPFTAARGRNAGFAALAAGALPTFVQFVDGDCAVVRGWIAAGLDKLRAEPDLGMVTGWRSELHRNASVYNAMCDVEWRRPAGDILACGGDMLVRAVAWQDVGGMNEEVIAAEDDEICVRLRKAGWRLYRIAHEMTRHDADMTRFAQWWHRAVRTGHGFAQVGHLHPDYFQRERKRTWVWALGVPLAILAATLIWGLWMLLPGVALYAASWWRSARGLERHENLSRRSARHHALFLTIGKFPNLLGMVRFHIRRVRGSAMKIIEYK